MLSKMLFIEANVDESVSIPNEYQKIIFMDKNNF